MKCQSYVINVELFPIPALFQPVKRTFDDVRVELGRTHHVGQRDALSCRVSDVLITEV
jgi:hypothetical protein